MGETLDLNHPVYSGILQSALSLALRTAYGDIGFKVWIMRDVSTLSWRLSIGVPVPSDRMPKEVVWLEQTIHDRDFDIDEFRFDPVVLAQISLLIG